MRILGNEVRERGVLLSHVAPPAVDSDVAHACRAVAEQAGPLQRSSRLERLMAPR